MKEKASAGEEESLVGTDSDLEDYETHEYRTPNNFLKRSCRDLSVAIIAITLVLIIQFSWQYFARSNSVVHTIAQREGFLQKSRVSWDLTLGKTTIYTNGTPSSMDKAWDDISAPPGKLGNIKVAKEDLLKMGDISVPYADGSGYLVTVDVFHQLHCLDYLRRQIMPTGGAPIEEDDVIPTHILHCIDSLRSYIQCHADTSFITFKWLPDFPTPFPDFRTTHQCYDWDTIYQWAVENSVDAQPEEFSHPITGVWNGEPPEHRFRDWGHELHFLPMSLD